MNYNHLQGDLQPFTIIHNHLKDDLQPFTMNYNNELQ